MSMAETAAGEIVVSVAIFSGNNSDSGRALILGVEQPSSLVRSISDVDEEGVCLLLLDGIAFISNSWTLSFVFVSEGILKSSMEGFNSAE